MTAFDGVIAANRFGFGARAGDLARIGAQGRQYLLQQLQGPAPLLTDALPASHELLARVLAERATLRQPAGNRRSAAVQPPAVQPAAVKAAMAVSMSEDECAADIWVRMRAWPFGTTGKKKPVT